MSALAESLLSELTVEEFTNPDVGPYEDAIFTGGEARVTKKGGYMMVAKFEAPRKSGNGTIHHKEYVNLAKADSHPRVKQMALGWYRAFGVVPSGTKNLPICKDFSDAEKLVSAINGDTAGKVVGISLHEDDSGNLRARARKLIARTTGPPAARSSGDAHRDSDRTPVPKAVEMAL